MGKVLSQMTTCHLEAQPLSLANNVEAAAAAENGLLQNEDGPVAGSKMQTGMQGETRGKQPGETLPAVAEARTPAGHRWAALAVEGLGPSLSLKLERDGQSAKPCFLPTAGPPLAGRPVCFSLTSGLHFGSPATMGDPTLHIRTALHHFPWGKPSSPPQPPSCASPVFPAEGPSFLVRANLGKRVSGVHVNEFSMKCSISCLKKIIRKNT